MNKPILAIETSGALCSVCLFFSEVKHHQINSFDKMSNSKTLVKSINTLLDFSGIAPGDLDSTAVSIGPGSFTGLRIGLAVAKGIAYGANLPVIPVPSFDALALQCCDFLPDNKPIGIAIKANHDEVYFNSFTINQNSFNFTGEIRIIKQNELNNYRNDYHLVSDISTQNKTGNKLSQLPAYYVAKWANIFGTDCKSMDYDYLEPMYIKDFEVKRS